MIKTNEEREKSCHLSDGARAVVDLMKSEPFPSKMVSIKPENATKVRELLRDAEMYAYEKMPWLKGVYVSPQQLDEILFLLGKIKTDLENGAEFEGNFWDDAKKSQESRNDFIKTLLEGVESGRIKFSNGDRKT